MGAFSWMNGSSTNSVKPPVRSWIDRITRRWPTQCAGGSTCPYIIVEEVRRPSSCAVVTTSIHTEAGSLPLVSTQRTSSSRISAAVPGPRPRQPPAPRLLGPDQPLPDRQAGPRGAVHHLHRGERVYVKIWAPTLDFGSDFEVRCAWYIGMDPALHAHLGGPGGPGLGRAVT